MKSIFSYLNKKFCIPTLQKTPENLSEYKLMKRENITIFYVVFLSLIFSIIGLFGFIFPGMKNALSVTVSYTLILLLIFLKHHKLSKYCFVAHSLLVPFLFLFEEKTLILVPIYIIVYPVLNSVLLHSFKAGAMTLLYFLIMAYLLIKLAIVEIILKASVNEQIIYMERLLNHAIMVSFLFISLFSILITSNVEKIDNSSQEFSDLVKENLKLLEENTQMKKTVEGKSNFMLSVSHELRNPLNSVLGNIDLAISNVKYGQLFEKLQNCKISGEILLYLINNILDSGKMENGTLDVSSSVINIKQFVSKMWSTTKILIQKKKLTGQLFYATNIPDIILADTHRLMQIMFNIVGNASKFTTTGYIKVVVSWESIELPIEIVLKPTESKLFNDYHAISKGTTENFTSAKKNLNLNGVGIETETIVPKIREFDVNTLGILNGNNNSKGKIIIINNVEYFILNLDSEKIDLTNGKSNSNSTEGYLKFEVVDTGYGMSFESVQKLFTKFGQVGNLIERKLGTGIGLWLSQQLCKKMDGDIKAYSKEGIGSTFVMAIKCKVADNTQLQEHHRLQLQEEARRQLRALVVDDDKVNQEIIRSFVEKCGIHVDEIAANGKLATEIYKNKGNNYFDFVFMDLDMPKMNGKTASTKIREMEDNLGWNPVTLIIVSGNYIEEEVNECLNVHGKIRAKFFFPKPFTLNQCKTLLATYLSTKNNSSNTFQKYTYSKILVVDDDIFNSNILCEYLKKLDIKFITAVNGKEAVKRVQENYKDLSLIFMDCEMPMMNGTDATKAIKEFLKKYNLPDIPIYGLTGHEGQEYHKVCFESGMIKVLTKPISFEKIKSIL